MKKKIGIIFMIVLLIVAGIGFFYYRSLQTSSGTIIVSTSPPVRPTPTTQATATHSPAIADDQGFIPNKEFNTTETDADFVLAGINVIKAKPKDVLALYGQPQSKGAYGAWNYPGFSVNFNGGDEIERIEINSGEYQTARGIKIGDPAEKVFKKYGIHDQFPKSWHEQFPSNQNWYSYVSNNCIYSIDFHFKNGKVFQISISIYMSAEPPG